jgi:RNA polymerase sigma-70 factor (ECF subfamily)
VTPELIELARGGDTDAFAELVRPFLRELRVHCYRILGSTEDAEDALQEVLMSAWRGLGGFAGQASLRGWLYRIATNRCLDVVRSSRRRPRPEPVPVDVEPPEPSACGEVLWLQPYPDLLLDGLADQKPGPEARYEAREAISLAFVTALQLLPPRQRAVLVLQDVMGFRASEVAEMLDTTEDSAKSALKRGRATLRSRLMMIGEHEPAPPAASAVEREIVERFATAYETGDLDGVVQLLTDDVRATMPPTPLEYHSRTRVARFLEIVSLRPERTFRLVPTRANGQPAFGFYVRAPHGEVSRATGLLVLTLSGNRVCALTHFDNSVLPSFGLPRMLPPI